MFNLSAPLRKRSGDPPLNPGLPEHNPKKRRTKEPASSTEEQHFDPNLGSRLEHAVDDRHRQIMSAQAPLKERIEDESAKGAGNDESTNGSANEENAKGSGNDESAKGSGNEESADDFDKPVGPSQEWYAAYKEKTEARIRKRIGNTDGQGIPSSQESTNGSSNNEGSKDPSTQESSSASINE
jgi:hypothetical protein